MAIETLLKKIRQENAEIEDKIKEIEKEIEVKENVANLNGQLLVNTQWEKSQIRRLREKLS